MELLANFFIDGDDKHCDLRPSGSHAKCWQWTAVDASQSTLCIEIFALKFGTSEAATKQNLAARFTDTDTLNGHLKNHQGINMESV